MTNELKTLEVSPAQMLAAAIDKGIAIDQLGSLMALYEKFESNKAVQAFNQAVAKFKHHPPEIFKNKEVRFGNTKYSHALLKDIVDAATPALCAVGLSVRWEIDQAEQITVRCILSHVDGHSESVSMKGPADSSGNKNAIQQIGSTVSYLQRYTLMSILGLAARGLDDDGKAAITHKSEAKLITDEQVLFIEAFITENELNRNHIIDYLHSKGYQQFADIPASKFDQFFSVLKKGAKK